MAEPIKFDEKAALQKLDAAEKAHRDVVGKSNYNPFFVINHIEALRAAVKRGVTTEQLAKDIAAIPATPTPINPNLKDPVEEKRVIEA